MNSLSLSPAMRRILLEALILCVLSATVGLSLNFKLIFNAFSGKSVSAPISADAVIDKSVADNVAAPMTFPLPVELEELDELLSSGTLLIDSRNFADFQESHLAGALSLPFSTLEDDLTDFRKKVAVDQTLVIYCSGYGCTDSFDLGVRLLNEGYSDVLVYEGGFPEWQAAGRPLEGGRE